MSKWNPLNLGRPLSRDTSSPSSTSNKIQDPTNLNAQPTDPSVDPTNITAPLTQVRTAPTTVPINPSVHEQTSQPRQSPENSDSSSVTLHSQPGGIPIIAGGLHGQSLPGAKARLGMDKDPQAGTIGGSTGGVLVEMASKELHLSPNTHQDGNIETHGTHHDGSEGEERMGHLKHMPTWNIGSHGDPGSRIERTATGTIVSHRDPSGGQETVQGFGMVPLSRHESQPPVVSYWGGVAPAGIDAEEGLTAVRSREEEEERELEREIKGPDPWAVKFEPGEKINPKNWGVAYRWWLTSLAGLFVLNSTFASSSPSGIITDLEEYFHISQEVAVLTISLFVAGYCCGPLVWGPASEIYGRRPIFILSFIVYTGFQVGCALAKNPASILIFRFLGGTFASAPLTNSGGLLADIWDVDRRGSAMVWFALAPFAGPSIGPIVAGFIEVSGTNWRWVFWILTMFAGFCLVVIIFCVPETYGPTILVKKAKRLRKETGEERYYAPLERASHRVKDRLNDILLKPFVMLALEPMLLAVVMYMSFVYGVVYLLFEAYPFVFIINHGFNSGENELLYDMNP
ncbi:polyamine transporter 1, partial [Tremella mesenterica]